MQSSHYIKFSDQVPPESINYIKELESIIPLLPEDKKKDLEGRLKSKCGQQIISAYFELGVYEYLEELNFPTNSLNSIEGYRCADWSITLSNGSEVVIECTVLYENYEDNDYKVFELVSNIYNKLDGNRTSARNIEITNIKLKGKHSKKIEDEIREFFYEKDWKPGVSHKFTCKSLEFTCQESIEFDVGNNRGICCKGPKLKDPYSQFKKAIKEKVDQLSDYEKPCVVAICNGMIGSWYKQNFEELLEKIRSYGIDPKISASLLMPNFLPLTDECTNIMHNKNELIFSPILFHNNETGRFIPWSKEGRTVQLMENPKADYSLDSCFLKRFPKI